MVDLGTVARLYKAAVVSTAMTGEAMTDTGDHLRYRITNRAKMAWDDVASFTVNSDGTPVAAANYTIHYPVGEVEFTSSMAGHTITVTGAYFALDKMFKSNQAELSREWEDIDITAHGDTAICNYPTLDYYRLRVAGRHDSNVWQARSGAKYIVVFAESGTYSADKIDTGLLWAFYALAHPKFSAGVKDVQKDDVELRSTGPVYYRSD